MNRRRVVHGVLILTACSFSVLLVGCILGALVVWEISPEHSTPTSSQDIERLRQLLNTLGYVKDGEDLRSGSSGEFFSLPASPRFDVALLPEANGTIRLKFVEFGDKKLSSMGRQQVVLIADGLKKEFGRERVVLLRGPD